MDGRAEVRLLGLGLHRESTSIYIAIEPLR